MNKFPILIAGQLLITMSGWFILSLIPLAFLLEFMPPEIRGPHNPDFLMLVEVLAILFFAGGTMLMTSYIINILLRIENHLDFLRYGKDKNRIIIRTPLVLN